MIVCLRDGAVAAIDPHQAFVQCDLARFAHSTIAHRRAQMRRSLSAATIFVGGAHALAPQRVALRHSADKAGRSVTLAQRAACSASCARAEDFRHAAAWRGAVTPPIVTVTATGPATVIIGLRPRTPRAAGSAATAARSAKLVSTRRNLSGDAARECILAAHARANAPWRPARYTRRCSGSS